MGAWLRSRRVWTAVVLVAAVAAGGTYWIGMGGDEAPRFRTAKVERGPLVAVVAATGTLNPVSSVQVGTQVSGQIKELLVDFNSPVKKGQLVARIDPETFQYRVRQAQADAEAARSALNRARVSLANAQRELDRTKELVARSFVSPAELDARQSAYDLAQADVRSAQAVVAQREASLASAGVDLARTEIRAPVDGVVIKRSVDVGQTVAASLQAPELFVIARDLRDMQVETSIDEADVGRIRTGQRASFTVDAFPGRSFGGEVRQIRKSAQNVQNVVTYTVLIGAANEGGLLMPGMTANVRIVTDRRESVLKVPNAALRFRPPGDAAAVRRRESGDDGGTASAVSAGPAQMRDRLIAELKLDQSQQATLDGLLAAQRERLASLRALPEEARAKAAAAARAELRSRIDEILRPEQKARYAELAAEQGGRAAAATRGRVYLLQQGRPAPVDVQVGLSDGTASEVAGDLLTEGAEVLVGVLSAPGSSGGGSAARGGPPRLMF
jgi:HlyD family secretion protein